MRGAGVPEEDHGAPQGSEPLSKELDPLRGSDVLVGVKPGRQPDALPVRRNTEGREGRELFPAAGAPPGRGLAAGCPGSGHVGDQEKATFIEEGQMGPTPFGVFLSAAIGIASHARWPLRLVPGPAARASDSSLPDWSGLARRDGRGSRPHTPAGLRPRPDAASRGRWDSRTSRPPSTGAASIAASAVGATGGGCPAPAWPVPPPPPSC